MELSDYRKRLDEIDEEILHLFSERMDIAVEIASWKQENSLPVLDARREKEKLQRIEEMSDPELSDYSFTLFSMLMELSRSRQNRILHRDSPETRAIETALRDTPQLFPEKLSWRVRGSRVRIPESPARNSSCVRVFFIFPHLMQCSPQWKRGFAGTV